jgi:hypothetical protein
MQTLVGMTLSHTICCVTESDNYATQIDVAEESSKSTKHVRDCRVPCQMCSSPHEQGYVLRAQKLKPPLGDCMDLRAAQGLHIPSPLATAAKAIDQHHARQPQWLKTALRVGGVFHHGQAEYFASGTRSGVLPYVK